MQPSRPRSMSSGWGQRISVFVEPILAGEIGPNVDVDCDETRHSASRHTDELDVWPSENVPDGFWLRYGGFEPVLNGWSFVLKARKYWNAES